MNILFLSSGYKTIHRVLVKEITACFERNNHRVSSEFNPSGTYDCILVFNRNELKKHQKDFEILKAPVIYLFCISDIAKEFPVTDSVTKIIVLKDKILNVEHLSFASLIYQDMILPVNPLRPTLSDNKRSIYVNIEDDYLGELTFLKLLPLFNILHTYDIHYQSKKGIGRQFINKHIRLINPKCNVEDCISQANIIIASGYTAYLAILQGKKTIVVGEKGYGGLVTEDNLEYHLANFFQGRNGGKFDEYIPFPLMQQAIETEIPDTQKMQEKFVFLQNQNQKKWIQLIEAMVSSTSKEETDLAINYILNPDYNLMKRNNRIWLSKQVFWKLYQSVNESESAVISAFRQPHSIPEVLNTFPAEYEEDISEYIQELIMEKKLILVEMNHQIQ